MLVGAGSVGEGAGLRGSTWAVRFPKISCVDAVVQVRLGSCIRCNSTMFRRSPGRVGGSGWAIGVGGLEVFDIESRRVADRQEFVASRVGEVAVVVHDRGIVRA